MVFFPFLKKKLQRGWPANIFGCIKVAEIREHSFRALSVWKRSTIRGLDVGLGFFDSYLMMLLLFINYLAHENNRLWIQDLWWERKLQSWSDWCSHSFKKFRAVPFPHRECFSAVLRQEGYSSPDQSQVLEREEEKKLFFFWSCFKTRLTEQTFSEVRLHPVWRV